MLKVSEILRVKGDVLYTISPDDSVENAIKTMSEHDIGSVVVIEHGELAGMLTFREIIRHIDSKKEQFAHSTVRSIMDSFPVSVTPNTELAEVQRLMLEQHARYVPVLDGPTLLGIISFYDMARALIDLEQFENNMLKAYIRHWPDDKEET
ncbi:CBS domain-containing protein [Pelistega ratti]|uniref:CBS domain-containing protein n=1 Tax=Pelistega ratti TaxID=2652177 RepID=UPI00135B85C0|nr:CBS domain-containing protein [Pelistega ratti]